jgi:MOSC domain-containing protein YiiM
VPDDEVCIGDRFAIGSALLEVSQPRVTCFKVGIRPDEPRMPALLTGHGRPGFYLRVLEEGEIGAGDVIERVGREGHGLTVGGVSDPAVPAGLRRGSAAHDRRECGAVRGLASVVPP